MSSSDAAFELIGQTFSKGLPGPVPVLQKPGYLWYSARVLLAKTAKGEVPC